MITLVIFAALCFLLSQWDGQTNPRLKADTSVVRLLLMALGIVLWALHAAHLIVLPIWLRS